MRLKEITEGLTIGDKLLLIILIMISVSGFVFIKKAFPQGTDVTVEVNSKPEYKLPLNVNATVSVKGLHGDTIIEIRDNKVRIKESACPNRICIHNGWINRGAIICLPNRVIVFIGSPENRQNETVDAISG